MLEVGAKECIELGKNAPNSKNSEIAHGNRFKDVKVQRFMNIGGNYETRQNYAATSTKG